MNAVWVHPDHIDQYQKIILFLELLQIIQI
jgi:hypothetical protein